MNMPCESDTNCYADSLVIKCDEKCEHYVN